MLTVDRLQLFAQARDILASRRPLGGPGSWVSLMLSYNGSAWLNTVIASCYLVGNKVLVKFSSKGAQLRALLESVYRPIFGDDIVFYQGRGQSFMAESLANPQISTVVVFGFDAHTLAYQDAFQQSGKKLVFEGRGLTRSSSLPTPTSTWP